MRALSSAYPGDRVGVFVFTGSTQRSRAGVFAHVRGRHDRRDRRRAPPVRRAAPLGAYVAERQLVELTEPVEIVSLQGQHMGRPSTVRIRLELRSGRATNIQVGGGVVPVLEGELTLPRRDASFQNSTLQEIGARSHAVRRRRGASRLSSANKPVRSLKKLLRGG